MVFIVAINLLQQIKEAANTGIVFNPYFCICACLKQFLNV